MATTIDGVRETAKKGEVTANELLSAADTLSGRSQLLKEKVAGFLGSLRVA